jgi:hypothetical protein
MVPDLVLTGLAVLDGTEFDHLDACRQCGGTLTGYDWKERTFATLVEGGTERDIRVRVKRFICSRCGRMSSAYAPFYPDTRVGSPVVDLCITLCRTMPFSRASAYLRAMGILLDRGSCRNYAQREFGEIRTTEIFGVRIPLSVLSLSLLASRNPQGGPVIGAEAFAACGFPSAHRTAPDRPAPSEQRDKRNEKEQEEKRQAQQE